MLRIYGHPHSINVRKVLWTLVELQQPFELEHWGGSGRSTNEPQFRELNPCGMVPVIDDAGVVLRESNTIIRYLAAKHQRHDLLPAEPAARAQVEQWMDWQATDFNNSWRVCFQALVRKNPAFTDPRAIENSLTQFGAAVALVDEQLARTDAYVVGAQFTLADIVIGLSLHRWRSMPVTWPRHASVERYYSLLQARPGFLQFGVGGGA